MSASKTNGSTTPACLGRAFLCQRKLHLPTLRQSCLLHETLEASPDHEVIVVILIKIKGPPPKRSIVRGNCLKLAIGATGHLPRFGRFYLRRTRLCVVGDRTDLFGQAPKVRYHCIPRLAPMF